MPAAPGSIAVGTLRARSTFLAERQVALAAPKFWRTTQPSIPYLAWCFRSGNTRIPKPAAGLSLGEGRGVVALAHPLPALIHPSAWKAKGNSRNFAWRRY